MSLKFKTDKIRDEYAQLASKNPALLELIVELTGHVADTFQKDVMLTSVYRTPVEQANLYALSVKKVITSLHSSWEAVDLRSWIYTDSEIDSIVAYLNTRYKNKSGRNVALYHAIAGGVPHFHIALEKA